MANKLRLKLGSLAGIELVAVAAVASSTEKSKETDLKVVCKGGGDTGKAEHAPIRIKQVNRCPTCEFEAGGYTKFGRGRDNGDGTFTVLTKEQIEEAKVEKVLTITLDLTRHETSEVLEKTVPSGKFYYLAPSEGSADDYPMFVEMVREDPTKTFCTMYAVRTAPSMWRLGVLGDVLTLQEMADPVAVKAKPEVQVFEADKLGDELEMARLLSKKITEPFDPAKYVDSRKDKLAAMLAEAEAEQGGESTEAVPTFAGKSSLLAALKASVEAAASGGPVLVDTGSKVSTSAATDVSDPAATTDVAPAAPKRTRAKKSA